MALNPYLFYSIGFSFALLCYTFGWSYLYPSLQPRVVIFLCVTILAGAAIGFLIIKKYPIARPSGQLIGVQNAGLITGAIYILWTIEFVHAGGVPLVKIITHQPYDYRLFGVPTLHVIVVTFSSFFTIFLFHAYVTTRSRGHFLLFIINLFAAMLIYNRGMFLFNITGAMSILLVYTSRIRLRHVLYGTTFVAVLAYGFGVVGSARVSHEARKSYSNADFLSTGGATPRFLKSGLPPEFFWSYIYLSSPIANLQHNVNTHTPPPVTPGRLSTWAINETLPDFLSKRINRFFGLRPEEAQRITGPFNAASIHTQSFLYLGFTGMALITFTLFLLPWVYVKLIPHQSPFFLTGIALLNTMFLFSIFVNTISFTGLSFQLVYPVILHYSRSHLILTRAAPSTTR